MGCANQAGEDNRNVARMAALLAGLPTAVSGFHDQPAVRFGAGRGRHRGASDQVGRCASDAGRRGRKHDPRAVRHGQGDRGVLPLGRSLRHHHRLALRQHADAKALRHDSMPETAENVAEGSRCPAPIRTRSHTTASSARRRRAGKRLLRQAKSRRWRSRAARATRCGRARRASAWRHHAGEAGEARTPFRDPGGTVTAGNASGVNDGSAALIMASEEGGEAAWPDAARARGGDGDRRRAAADHGYRSGAGSAEAAGKDRDEIGDVDISS